MRNAAPDDTTVGIASSGDAGRLWLPLGLIAVALAAVFHQGLLYVIEQWQREEYSYGYIVPPITALLVWGRLKTTPADGRTGGSWLGVLLVLLAVLIVPLARIAGMPSAIYYAFLVAVYGVFLAALGWRRTRHATPALAYLVFALPLPQTLYLKLSTALQTVSSIGSVELMRGLGVKVLRQGNIIDLGIYQLQVAEACSGLGYLFPLASFAYLLAYLYRGGWWGRIIILVATIPITLAINILRIAITGVLVDYVGVAAAEGFIHAFEGYAIFAVGALLFILMIWAMARIGGDAGSLLKRFRFEEIFAPSPQRGRAPLSRALLAAGLVLVLGGAATLAMPGVRMTPPERQSLVTFPMRIGDWRGREGSIEPNFLAILRLDDYLLADYADEREGGSPVNLYIAYYNAQNENATIHSPKVCIPAGGWEITDLSERRIPGLGAGGAGLTVNRAVIGWGLERQLVYYWFELRGRQMTGEYAIKLMNLWDGLRRGRTDGALVRVSTPLPPDEGEAAADARLQAFLVSAYPHFSAYIPG